MFRDARRWWYAQPGPPPPRGELYEAGGTPIASGEPSGSDGRNFRIEAELASGTYYVAVTGAPGRARGYAVSARARGTFDHAGDMRTATPLPLRDVLDLARATPDMLLGTAGRVWPTTADVDAFRLDVARERTVVRVRTSGGTALHARLVHAGEALTEVASDDRGGDIDLEATLDPGVYYLLIGGRETGAYRVLAWGYEAGHAPPDKAGFDALVAGKSLSALHLEAARFGPARRFSGTLDKAHRSGRYTYERARCGNVGWVELEYDDGGRCSIVLHHAAPTRGGRVSRATTRRGRGRTSGYSTAKSPRYPIRGWRSPSARLSARTQWPGRRNRSRWRTCHR